VVEVGSQRRQITQDWLREPQYISVAAVRSVQVPLRLSTPATLDFLGQQPTVMPLGLLFQIAERQPGFGMDSGCIIYPGAQVLMQSFKFVSQARKINASAIGVTL
jgi:hypothetical protein